MCEGDQPDCCAFIVFFSDINKIISIHSEMDWVIWDKKKSKVKWNRNERVRGRELGAIWTGKKIENRMNRIEAISFEYLSELITLKIS